MALKQTRRTVSMNRQAYEDLRKYSQTSGEPMSQLVQAAVAAMIDGEVCRCGKYKPWPWDKKKT